MLSTVVVVAHAETIPATNQTFYTDSNGLLQYSSRDAVCVAYRTTRYPDLVIGTYTCGGTCISCRGYDTQLQSTINYGSTFIKTALGCPSGQNWTLNGSNCNRPDCVAPQVRGTDGVCKLNPCTNKPDASGLIGNAPGTDISGLSCNGSCEIHTSLDISYTGATYKNATTQWLPYVQSYTGNQCSTNTTPAIQPVANQPPSPPKKPPCAATEGVLTSTSGTVACVPPGVAGESVPGVTTNKKVETYPDNTTKTTETTKTTDPATGATDTNTKVTSTAKPDGTAGNAGTPGSKTGTSDTSGTPDGKGDCDPTLQMCGKPGTDKLYTPKTDTFSSVMTKFSDGMKSTEIGNAFTTFFDVSVPSSGSCPDLSVSIGYLNTTIDLAQYICNGKATEYFQMMGNILKIAVGYIAFTWVFL